MLHENLTMYAVVEITAVHIALKTLYAAKRTHTCCKNNCFKGNTVNNIAPIILHHINLPKTSIPAGILIRLFTDSLHGKERYMQNRVIW